LVVTSQPERQWKLLKSTTNSFIIHFDMSYGKLWSLLSSSALISANHKCKLVTLHLLTKDRQAFCSQHGLMSWRDVHIGQDERKSLQLIGNTHINQPCGKNIDFW